MNIHEYQAKAVLREFGVPVPRGVPAFSVDEAVKGAEQLGGPVWVVKAQIHAGGRGKAGGVKVVKSIDDVKKESTRILGSTLVTHQTGPHGKTVHRLYVEEGSAIDREFYLSALIDRETSRVAFVVSTEGGMDIEAALAMTFGMMYVLGIDVQQVSIAALIIALGLLVDDPVVAGDAIKNDLSRGTTAGDRRLAWSDQAGQTNYVCDHNQRGCVFTLFAIDRRHRMVPLHSADRDDLRVDIFAHRLDDFHSASWLLPDACEQNAPADSLEERRRRGVTGFYFRVGTWALEHR